MALVLKKETLPGFKTLKKIYDLIPGGGQMKAILVTAVAGALIVAGIAAGAVGICALLGYIGGSLLGSTLLTAGIVAALPFVFKGLAGAIRTLYTFNWNISDKEINENIKSSLANLYGTLGTAAGTATGWLLCGILPGVVTFAFNPVVARAVMQDMTQEAQEEIWGQIAACQNGAVALLGNALMLNGYKSARRWLKRPDSPFYGFLKEHFGDNFEKWGNDNQPSFTFSDATENKIEQIEDKNWRNFTEQFVESLLESCTEALDNLSNSMRANMSAYLLAKKQLQTQGNRQVTVELDFSRNDDPDSDNSTNAGTGASGTI
jgi:hypothetical protein